MGNKARSAEDPFGEKAMSETRTQARQRNAAAKKAATSRSSREDDDSKGGIRWGPLVMMMLIVLSGLLPFLSNLADSLGRLGVTVFNVDHQTKLMRFYKAHNADKVDEVPSLLRKYKGREDVLYKKLHQKYGVWP